MVELSEYQVDLLKLADERRRTNLEFFKNFHKKIYDRFKDYKLSNYKISLNTNNNQLDVVHNGLSIYDDNPKGYAQHELGQFYDRYGENKTFHTLVPPFGGYYLPRFLHRALTSMINDSPITKEKHTGYLVPDFYPMMVFHGVGVGYHVEEFLTTQQVINCLVLENNEELFACSLYTVNWKEVCKPFVNDKNKNIHFIIGPMDSELRLQAYEFKYLSSHCPIYPLTTLLINHRNEEVYTRLTKKMNEDTTAFATVWGHYDDEIYQLNNCLHNLHNPHKIIRPNEKNLTDIPIAIIGGGPSLNERIETLIQNRDKLLIVSCGTAIHSLYHYGIKPDIHFELESHLVTLTHLKALDDPEWLKSIPIVGPTQLPPRVFDLFDQKAMYFKGESATNFLFGTKETEVHRGTPTCTNGAIALFLNWGFRNMFLFGIDMGYKNTDNHHAKGSIYYKTNDKELSTGAHVQDEATVSLVSVKGETMKTKPILYTAKRTIETCAFLYKNTTSMFNCSDGAEIENTKWIDSTEFNQNMALINPKGHIKDFLALQFTDNNSRIDNKTIDSRIDVLEHNIKELSTYICNELKNTSDDFYTFTCTINGISRFLERQLKPELPSFYFFIRGSIWHMLYIGYAHALSIRLEDDKEKWISTWKDHVYQILKDLNAHFSKVVHKDFDMEKDPWTWMSTSEEE